MPGGRAACFVAPVTEAALVLVVQADAAPRSHLLDVAETTLWANWFFIGGTYSSYVLVRNTSDAGVHATITWRAADSGAVVGTLTETIPPGGVVFHDARAATDGTAASGSVEIGHDGDPDALIGSATTLSATTGLSFDTIAMQRGKR